MLVKISTFSRSACAAGEDLISAAQLIRKRIQRTEEGPGDKAEARG